VETNFFATKEEEEEEVITPEYVEEEEDAEIEELTTLNIDIIALIKEKESLDVVEENFHASEEEEIEEEDIVKL